MATAVNVHSHPDFTVDQLISYTGWTVPTPVYREHLRQALEYFQRTVPRAVLRESDDAGPWNLAINGVKIRLLNWLQGINFHEPVNAQRIVNKGDPLIAFKDPSARPGRVRGNWFTFPSTRHEAVAIPNTQTGIHKFKARSTFNCMQSTVSDAHVAWVRELPAEYRHGGGQQLFIWDASSLLEPA